MTDDAFCAKSGPLAGYCPVQLSQRGRKYLGDRMPDYSVPPCDQGIFMGDVGRKMADAKSM